MCSHRNLLKRDRQLYIIRIVHAGVFSSKLCRGSGESVPDTRQVRAMSAHIVTGARRLSFVLDGTGTEDDAWRFHQEKKKKIKKKINVFFVCVGVVGS